MNDGSAHVWRLVMGGEVWVTARSRVLVMASLVQLLVLQCGDMYRYPIGGEWERDGITAHHSYGEESNSSYICKSCSNRGSS